MKSEAGKLVFETREEVEIMINIIETAFETDELDDDELKLANRVSGILEIMDMTW